MIRKTPLPNGRAELQFIAKAFRRPALDELHGPFERRFFSGRQQEMKMIPHQNERVQLVSSLVAIVQQRLHENFASARGLEDGSPFPRFRGHEIRSRDASMTLRNRHFLKCPSAAKAALLIRLFGTAEAVPLREPVLEWLLDDCRVLGALFQKQVGQFFFCLQLALLLCWVSETSASEYPNAVACLLTIWTRERTYRLKPVLKGTLPSGFCLLFRSFPKGPPFPNRRGRMVDSSLHSMTCALPDPLFASHFRYRG